jgi:acylphosphatase
MQTIIMKVTGRVQGVFFRQSTREKALALGITGTVCNLADGSVEVVATGTKQQLDELMAWCRQGPAKAEVTGVEWQEETLRSFPDFKVVR